MLRVLSYNVHRCIGVDGRRDPLRIGKLIQSSGADIVGLQEVDFACGGARNWHQLDELAEATGFIAVAGPTIRTAAAEFGNALLTRAQLLKLDFVDLSVSKREPRGLIDAHLMSTGKIIRVLVTHLGLKMNERRQQAQALVKALYDNSGAADVTLVMGDINEWRPRGFAPYSLDRLMGRAPAPRSFPVTFPIFSLDRIWVSPLGALKKIQILDHELAQTASDHRPVIAAIDLAHASLSGERND